MSAPAPTLLRNRILLTLEEYNLLQTAPTGLNPTLYNLELKVKKLYEPIITNSILHFNEELRNTKATVRIVITGGEAFNFYFHPNNVIETHDYDLKIVSIAPLTMNDSYIQQMHTLRDNIGASLITVLNGVGLEFIYPLPDGTIYKYQLQFYPQLSGNLFACMYTLGGYKDSLIDIMPLDPSLPYYRDALIENGGTSVSGNIQGYVTQLLFPVVDSVSGLLYVKLSYLIWDTIRMLQYSSTMVSGTENKLERYKQKYKFILGALDNPATWMKCGALHDYVVKCASQILKRDSKTYDNYDIKDLIQIGVNDSVLPAYLLNYLDHPNLKYLSKEYIGEKIRRSLRQRITDIRL